MWRQYQAGDIAGAANTQRRINELLGEIIPITGPILNGAKEILGWMGLPCGALRSPNRPLTDEESAELKRRLEGAGFFDETVDGPTIRINGVRPVLNTVRGLRAAGA